MSVTLHNKVIIITGATHGLGRELAVQLAAQGTRLALVARTTLLLEELKNGIANSGGQAEFFVCDITEFSQVKATVKSIFKAFGTVDILINNAGIWTDDEIEKSNPDRRRQTLETNVVGQIHFTEEILPHFTQANSGTIFNVISTSGVPDIPAGNNVNWKTYGASKWALAGYSQALRTSLADTRIKVIQFFPGGFESDMYEQAHRPNPHRQPWMMNTADVAEVAVFALTRSADMNVDKLVVSKIFT